MAKAKKGKLTIEDALVPVAEQPYEIPENWCWTRLNMLVNSQSGNSKLIKGKLDSECADGLYPAFSASGQDVFTPMYEHEGDAIVVSAVGARCGKTFLASGKWSAIANTHIIFPTKIIDTKYLYYLTNDENWWIRSGSAQPFVAVKDSLSRPFALPPKEEQKAIVEKIEYLFEKLDTAKIKALDVIDELLVLKRALLYQAFEGLLTKKWRINNGCSEAWEKKLLIDVLTEKPRNGYSPKPVDYPTPYKSMTLSATTSGVFKPEFYKYIDEKIEEDSYLWLKQGDILIQRANSLEKVGTSAIYTGGEHEFIYPDLIMKLQVKEGILPEFICYQLKTEKTMEYFRSNATGTAGNMPKINQKIVSNVEIMLPGEDEQKEIVSILNRLYERYDSIIENTQMTIDKIDDVKKAILYKAFRGELGTNISDEESSIELLKQILENN